MKKFILYFLTTFCMTSPLFSEGEDQAKKEGKQIAKEKNKEAIATLKSFFKNENLPFEKEDLLSDQDRGKEFDGKAAAAKTDLQLSSSIEQTLQKAIERGAKREEIEGTESFLLSSKWDIENAKKGIGIAREEINQIPEEKNIETCIEGSTYVRTIMQQREISIFPKKTQEIKKCQGHKDTKTRKWKTDAEEVIKEKKKEFSKNKQIASFDVEITEGGWFTDYKILITWKHKDNSSICDQYNRETKVIQEEKQIDRWDMSSSEKASLEALETNIDCHLLQTQEFNHGTRNIDGIPIYRDSWERRLLFSCKPDPNSKCERIRNQGGVLLKRSCLKEEEGECISWEKTYDLGGKGAYTTTKVTFDHEDIFGFGEFDSSYDKNTEFAKVISTLSILSDLETTLPEEVDISKKAIFSGSDAKCRRSFDSRNAFDCCYQRNTEGRGVFISAGLGACNAEEKELFDNNKEGKCHHIGPIKNLFMTSHVYCCFPTKLARIVQEEGRKQLELKWGTPEKPKCKGLSLSQLERLNFEKMDFTDFIEDLQEKIDKVELSNKLERLMKDFSMKISEDRIKQDTEGKIESQREKCKQGTYDAMD